MNIADLLEPIAGANPAGRDLRYQGDYDRIAEARRDENPNLPRGIWVRDVKQADWGLVERLCIQALVERSKDLRIASWLCEAWVRRDGFAGLAQGMELIDGLCRTWWEGLYPAIDNGDPSARIATVEWLNERLPAAIRQVALVTDPAQPGICFSWSQYLDAQRLEAVRLRDAAAATRSERSGAVTLAMFEACMARTDSDMLGSIVCDIEAALGGLAALDSTLDAYCGRAAPGLGKMRTVTQDIGDFVHVILGARDTTRAVEAPITARDVTITDSNITKMVVVPESRAPLTRISAYNQLAEIASFLAAAEPHSPVPPILKYVAGWRDIPLLSLEDMLRDNGGGIAMLLEALGIGFVVDTDG